MSTVKSLSTPLPSVPLAAVPFEVDRLNGELQDIVGGTPPPTAETFAQPTRTAEAGRKLQFVNVALLAFTVRVQGLPTVPFLTRYVMVACLVDVPLGLAEENVSVEGLVTKF